MTKSLVNFNSLSKPIIKLIEVIEKATGIIYEPNRIVKKARADAKADIIKKIGSVIEDEIDIRTIMRVVNLERKRQFNIDMIIQETFKHLNEGIDNDNNNIIEEDWISDFFNFSQDISNEQLQKIWGKLLANEVDKPGSISRRTLYTLRTISHKEALLFNMFCSNTIKITETIDNYNSIGMIIFPDEDHHKFDDFDWNIENTDVGILQEINLVQYLEFYLEEGDNFQFKIGDKVFNFKQKKEQQISFHQLTSIGKELYSTLEIKPNLAFLKRTEKYLKSIKILE